MLIRACTFNRSNTVYIIIVIACTVVLCNSALRFFGCFKSRWNRHLKPAYPSQVSRHVV